MENKQKIVQIVAPPGRDASKLIALMNDGELYELFFDGQVRPDDPMRRKPSYKWIWEKIEGPFEESL